MMISAFDRVENIVGKGENAGYQHFLLFPQCFHKASFLVSLKVQIAKNSHCNRIHAAFTASHCNNDLTIVLIIVMREKQPVAKKEYCATYL